MNRIRLLAVQVLCCAALLFARSGKISSFDFRQTPLSDVFKIFTLQTGKNVIAAPDIKDMPVTLYLENVRPMLALETLCKNHGLWYAEERNVIRVMKTSEFSKGLAFGREENLRHLPLKYASCLTIAEIVSAIYSDKITYSPPGTNESFNHIGTDQYPTIGAKVKAAGGGAAKAVSQKQSSGNALGGIEVNDDDITRLINRTGTVNVDSMLALQIGRTQTFLTVSMRDNSLIIRSVDEELLADVSSLIRRLDTPTKQVLLEMKILEVTLGDNFESFVDLSITPGGSMNSAGQVVMGKKGLSSIDLVNQGALASSSFKMGFVNDLLSYKMEMYEQEQRIKKIGSPLMLCANNAAGKFFQGVSTPVRKGYAVSTAKNKDGFVTNEYVTMNMAEEEVGITLEISPSINEDKTVALKIVAEISTILLGQGPQVPYAINGTVVMGQTDAVRKTKIQDIVVARDAQNLALGGLIEETEVDVEKKVPVLGSIPILRFFFTSQEKKKERKEIIFLIRPHIIESPMESDEVQDDYFQKHSQHPFYKDSVETLLHHDEKRDVLVATVPAEGGRRTAKLLEKNRDQMVDSITKGAPDSAAPIAVEHERDLDWGDRSAAVEDSSTAVVTPVPAPVTGAEKRDSVVLDSTEYDSVEAYLDAWVAAWSSRDIDRFMRYYHDSFTGKGRTREGWRAAKGEVFDEESFVLVQLRDIQVAEKVPGLLDVRFLQRYRSDSYCDLSEKILLIRKKGKRYAIVSEEVLEGSEVAIPCIDPHTVTPRGATR